MRPTPPIHLTLQHTIRRILPPCRIPRRPTRHERHTIATDTRRALRIITRASLDAKIQRSNHDALQVARAAEISVAVLFETASVDCWVGLEVDFGAAGDGGRGGGGGGGRGGGGAGVGGYGGGGGAAAENVSYLRQLFSTQSRRGWPQQQLGIKTHTLHSQPQLHYRPPA